MTSFQRTRHQERLWVDTQPSGPGDPVRIDSMDAALALLRDISGEPRSRAALRRIYAEAVGRASVCRETDHAVLEGLAWRLVTGQLKVRSLPLHGIGLPIGLLDVTEGPPPPAPAPAKPTWVEVQVLFADTGKPVPSLKLKIKPPGGDPAAHTTDSDGLIRVDDIKKSGDCVVTSEIKGVTKATAIVIGGALPAAPADDGGEADDTKYTLVRVSAYKVKTGDTLDKLAKKVGLTGKELAKFNWGTDVPKEINKHLRWDVGCSKKSGDNYIFDDSDNPGIIHLPEPIEASAATAGRTVLVVEKLAKAQPWLFSL